MELPFTLLILASMLLLLLAQKLVNSKYRRKEGRREAPGPWNLPILGSLHRILGPKLPHRALRDLSAVHGPIMRLKLGEIDAVVISSAEAAREITRTHDVAFASRPISKTVCALAYGGRGVIFSPYGERWRQMRRLCTLELLSPRRVRSFRSFREEEVSHLIRSLAAFSGAVVDLSSHLAGTSNNVVARAVIGGRCADQKLFFDALGGALEFLSGFSILDLFPSFPFLGYVTGLQYKLEQCRKKIDLVVEKIVREHAERMPKRSIIGEDDEESMAEDIVDVLLRIQQEGSLPFPLTTDNIKSMLVNDMLFAGSETTATIMEWAMSELIQNPNAMKKAQREVRESLGNIGSEGKVEEEVVASGGGLAYLHLVIMETLRLHPPAPLLLPRENQESCEVMGYTIPAKSMVMINVWAIQRDAKHWDNPDIFWPERFEESCLDFKGAHYEFLPFGAGRRICPGMQFGLATVNITLAYFLYYFDWENLGKKLDMREAFGTTLRRKSPLCIVPTLQFSSPPSK